MELVYLVFYIWEGTSENSVKNYGLHFQLKINYLQLSTIENNTNMKSIITRNMFLDSIQNIINYLLTFEI